MDDINELPETITRLDVPFKISAGPGAGKTTWLVNHIQNVIRNSTRLEKTKKVACITYTRIGADTVENKIKMLSDTNRLDIGTIHSFLYRNVVRPFSYLIKYGLDESELFNISILNGHVEHRPSHERISSWVNRIGTRYSYLYDQKKTDETGKTNFDKTNKLLSNFEWNLSDNKVEPRLSQHNFTDLRFPSTKLYEYKLSCWSKGIMHHEDVLFFTHYIFNKNPRVVEFVSNKFPYLFIDEFQDTNPLQTWIIKQLSSQKSTVGVIGDPAQSIFKFAGARRKDFNDFSITDISLFVKSKNYRSTIEIISLLNNLRGDIEQEPDKDTVSGDRVVLFVGDEKKAVKYIKDLDDEDYSVLCRANSDVKRLKNNIVSYDEDLISKLYLDDNDRKRASFIHSLVKAYDHTLHNEYKHAINELKRHLVGSDLIGIQKRRLLIDVLTYLKNNKDSTIVSIYLHLQPILKKNSISLTGLRKTKGDYKQVHKVEFEKFIPFLSKQTKVTDKIRTIHQSKGDEFNNVLLCLFDKTNSNEKVTKKIESILNDSFFHAKENISIDSGVGEETRLVYVACSRARKKLFINVPSLSKVDESKFVSLGVIVDRQTTRL
jgi:DNA helicase-2/ATP-dependent DNA helicase PcrA